MRYWPPLWHSEDDDNAPVDYSCASSVNEARRQQQAQGMREKGSSHSELFRKNPARAGSMSFRRDAADFLTETPSAFSRKLRDLGDDSSLARRLSETRGDAQDWGIPDDPFATPGTVAEEDKQENTKPAELPPETPQDADIPDWLRIARMNNTPDQTANIPQSRIRQENRQETAHTARDYAEAGYPAYLLQDETELQEAPLVARRRHGAQLAGNAYSSESYSRPDGLQAEYARERARLESEAPEEAEPQNVPPAPSGLKTYAPAVPFREEATGETLRRTAENETASRAARGSSYTQAHGAGTANNLHQPSTSPAETFFAPQPDDDTIEPSASEASERPRRSRSTVRQEAQAAPESVRTSAPPSRYGGMSRSAESASATVQNPFARPRAEFAPERTANGPANQNPYARPQTSAPRTAASGESAGVLSQMQHYVSARGQENNPAPEGIRRPSVRNAASTEEAPPVFLRNGEAVPAQEPTVEDMPEEDRPLRLPWIGIVAGLAILAAILLFIGRMNYEKKTETVYQERAQAEETIKNNHPFRYRDIITLTAKRYNLQPCFVAAIVLNESSFNPQAESNVGARGLMQLMDDTAEWIHGKMNDGTTYSFDAMYDPETNVEYGCWYLHYLSELFSGDPVLVTAAFHAGQGEIRNWLDDSRYSADGVTIPLEKMPEGPTRTYAGRVLRDYAAYKMLFE